ncbi:uncharacterized protein VTP21DRAFT_4869 [Calcarisporiella thermophila]|uniref:uncharacterized protein n=1 Tax=Calcarisporiella thermophila TaxID=911321 RepID=UPI00374498D1
MWIKWFCFSLAATLLTICYSFFTGTLWTSFQAIATSYPESSAHDPEPLRAKDMLFGMPFLAERYLARAPSEAVLATNRHLSAILQSFFYFLQNEKICVLVFLNMAYCMLYLLGRTTLRFFFGELRVIESQHMRDRLLNFLLFKVVFIGAILEPKWEDLMIWISWFTILGFLRIFSMLCRDRFEYLAFCPNVPFKSHLKILSLLVLILVSDVFWFSVCASIFPTMLLLLTFESFTLFLDTLQTLIKYGIHIRDLSTSGIWEEKGVMLYYTEFITDILILVATLGHYMHIILLHGVSLTLIDAVLLLNMRSVFNNLRKKITSYYHYLRVISDMQTRYPSATVKELQDYKDDCAICRDTMTNAKRLPCGHCFHASCLRAWFERACQAPSCPTCRQPLGLTSFDLSHTSRTMSQHNSMLMQEDGRGTTLRRNRSVFSFNSEEWSSQLPWNITLEVVSREPRGSRNVAEEAQMREREASLSCQAS